MDPLRVRRARRADAGGVLREPRYRRRRGSAGTGGGPGADHRGRALADIGICRQLPALAVVGHQRAGRDHPRERAELLHQGLECQLRAGRVGPEPRRARSRDPQLACLGLSGRGRAPDDAGERGEQLSHLCRQPRARDAGAREPAQCRAYPRRHPPAPRRRHRQRARRCPAGEPGRDPARTDPAVAAGGRERAHRAGDPAGSARAGRAAGDPQRAQAAPATSRRVCRRRCCSAAPTSAVPRSS